MAESVVAAVNFLTEFFCDDGGEGFCISRIVPAVIGGNFFFSVFVFDYHRNHFAVFVFGHFGTEDFDIVVAFGKEQFVVGVVGFDGVE